MVIARQIEISLTVNGNKVSVRVYPMERLLDVLRHQLNLNGTKEGCGEGECGSCSVLMDGVLVNSCLIPILQAQGSKIVTIEGVAQGARLNALQKAILEHGGAQCGICTPGIIMAGCYLLSKTPHPAREQINDGLGGNLCRCTGYTQICEAFDKAGRDLT